MLRQTLPTLSALLFCLLPVRAQEGAPPTDAARTTHDAIASASPEARAAWQRLTTAAGTAGAERAAIGAFSLRADARTRSGVQTNEVEFDYRYLAPDCIRFKLPDGKETGRHGKRQSDYWVRTSEGVVKLVGSDYATDRKSVRDMHALARNFVALSDPSALTITRLNVLAAAPADLEPGLRKRSQRMTWISVASPDFALFTDTLSEEGGPRRSFVVDLALQIAGPAVDLPRYAIIREEPSERALGAPRTPPMLLRLDGFFEANGFRIPKDIQVFGYDPKQRPAMFANKPSQEVTVIEANLRPPLTTADFQPE